VCQKAIQKEEFLAFSLLPKAVHKKMNSTFSFQTQKTSLSSHKRYLTFSFLLLPQKKFNFLFSSSAT
jgi:hypothetical protein